jgi:hypothetical protein
LLAGPVPAGDDAPVRRTGAAAWTATLFLSGGSIMRRLSTLVLVFGVIALASSGALAQLPIPGLGGGGGAMLLMNKSVQEELKMTKEQVAKVGGVQEKMMAKMPDLFAKLQGAKPEEREAKMLEIFKEINAEAEKTVKEFLKPEQLKRLKQIEMQVAGVGNFTSKETQKALKLTDTQQEKIKTIVDDLNRQTREMLKGVGRDPTKMAEMRKKMEGMRKDAEEKVNAILNAEQKKSYRDMLGDPFELKIERPGFKPN